VDARLRLATAEEVRALIAQLILGDDQADARIGGISLEPHQLSAVIRIQSAIDEFCGALLCDEVGMGKTFVATAIARRYARRLIVAPAALSEMWADALLTTEIEADFVSFEKLSRLRSRITTEYDMVIVDEAHHARNRATRRYARLEELSRRAKLLLLTATPIHNRREDLSALLSLFLGARENALTQAELARCVVRRGHEQLKSTSLIPRVLPTEMLQISDDPRIARELLMMPDPIPVRDGGLAGSLIARGLVHQWASSEAALNEALRRRIARSYALIASLEAGTYPTEAELRTWIFDDGALQLGFPELLAAPAGDAATLLESLRGYSNALERFRASHSARSSLDIERASMIAGIRVAHPKARIVAFAQYTETVSMLFRALARLGGVAMLTAHGARVAGGRLSRSEALSRFAPGANNAPLPASAERIDLLLSTDLLSEGVNLQDAEVVVHLDIPWTAARLEQRVGRAARMGSRHSAVSVYLLRPPASAAALLENEILVQRKWNIALHAVGAAGAEPFPDQLRIDRDSVSESVTTQTERLRAILATWRRPMIQVAGDEVSIASVSSPRSGFLAVVTVDAEPTLVVGLSGQLSTDLHSRVVACRLGSGVEVDTSSQESEVAFQRLREWADRESASASAGLADSSALRRKRLVNRIDTAIESAPPHSRGRRLSIAAKARRVAASQQSAAIEAELESLAWAPLSDDEYLAALALLDTGRAVSPKAPTNEHGPQVHALLLLRDDLRPLLVR
jgi:superfamily II DNA or RNA helicase